jgi:hypothetical protein
MRAAAALDVPPDAGASAARAAFLRRLAAEGFIPPESVVAAVNVLAGTACPVTPAAVDGPTGPDAEVEEFVRAYWSLAPAARRARWETLFAGNRNGSTRAVLRRLEAGLDVVVFPHADTIAEEIADLVRELFLLPPRERSLRRATWLVEHAARIHLMASSATGRTRRQVN